MANLVCSNDCDTNLPIIDPPQCGFEKSFYASEIQRLFVSKITAAPFLNVYNAAEWIARLDNEGANPDDPNRIIAFDVVGNLPRPTAITKRGSKRRNAVISNTYTLPYRIIEITNLIYEAARQFGCGGNYIFRFETTGGNLYGGNKGIIATNKIDLVLAEGDEGTEELQAELTFLKKHMIERGRSPIFETNVSNDDDDDEVFTFDTTITYTSATTNAAAGITGTALAIGTVEKFEFQSRANTEEDSMDMELTIGGVNIGLYTYDGEYDGDPFRYTATNGNVYTGTLADGAVTPTLV